MAQTPQPAPQEIVQPGEVLPLPGKLDTSLFLTAIAPDTDQNRGDFTVYLFLKWQKNSSRAPEFSLPGTL